MAGEAVEPDTTPPLARRLAGSYRPPVLPLVLDESKLSMNDLLLPKLIVPLAAMAFDHTLGCFVSTRTRREM